MPLSTRNPSSQEQNQAFQEQKVLAEQMSEAQMRLAVKASHVGLWDWDLISDQVTLTDQCKALLGLPRDASLNNEQFMAAVHPDDRACVRQSLARTLEEHTAYSAEYRIVWPDGSIHWLTSKAHGLYNAQGKPVHMVGVDLDVTELKRAEEQTRVAEKKVRTILESITDGFAHLDTQWCYTYVNRRVEEHTGRSREEMLGHCIWELSPALLGTPFEQGYREAMETQKEQHIEAFHPVAQRWMAMHVYPSKDGISLYAQDITARKEMEQQKDLFLGMTGHELKTPLAALRGTLQLVQRRLKRTVMATGDLPAIWNAFASSLQKNLEDSVRQVDVQTRLINDLLDVSRITANTLELSLQRCDLRGIVRRTIEDLRVTARGRVFQLELPTRGVVHVLADPDRVSQVVTNYVTNALRYSHPDQPVQIGLNIQGNMARVWVRDHGPGLSEKACEEIWQRFHQVKEVPVMTGSGKGLGLGLYICQMLIKQHHGEVGVESTPGEGSTFWFTLPIVV